MYTVNEANFEISSFLGLCTRVDGHENVNVLANFKFSTSIHSCNFDRFESLYPFVESQSVSYD